MVLKTFSVFDSKAKAYLKPLYSINEAVAVRAFTAAVKDPTHDFHVFAEDYTLFSLGEFDEETGEHHNPATPEPIITAMAIKDI